VTRDPATLRAMTPAAGARRDRLDRDAGRPLWAQLVDDLDQRLHSGEFSDEFPGEHELCREYDVSRHTVREALRRLRERGLLDSGRGRPTRIRQHLIEQPLGALYSLFREVESRGMVQRSDVLTLAEVTDPEVAARLALDPGTPLLHLARLRWAGDEPLAVDRAWLPMEVAAPLLDVDFSRAGLYDQLELGCGIRLTGGRELLTAGVPDDGDRELLQLPDDVGTLRIERTADVDGRPLEWRVTWLRGDRFAVSADWSRYSEYRMDLSAAGPPRT
jgi:GntR family transcriptional regulator